MGHSAKVKPLPRRELIHIGPWKRLASSVLYIAAMLLRLANMLRRENPRRVLVLEPVGLGDMVGFEPLVRELLARNYEVVICSKPEWRALYPDRPGQSWINARIPWTSHNEGVKYQIGLYFREPTRGDLKRMHAVAPGSIGMDTRGDIRSVLLLYWAGCKRVISLSNYLGSDLPMWRAAAEIVPFDNTVRRWELNVHFARALDATLDPKRVAPPRLAHLIRPQARRRVGLMPIAPWEGKLWRPERWAAVAEALRRDGWDVVGLCGPGQSQRARRELGGDISVVECGSVERWAEQFNQCALIITLDSGPMHLADAMGVPVVALFGQGKLPLWAPSGRESVVLAHRDEEFFVCHPIDANTHLGRRYMDRIPAEEVLAAARAIAKRIAPEQVPHTASP